MPSETANNEPPPTVRHREHIDGCGCIRCQGIDYTAINDSFAGALRWSGDLLRRRPTVTAVFFLVAAAQLLVARSPLGSTVVSALIGVVGVSIGRGYVGLLGAADLTSGSPDRRVMLRAVVARFPAFLTAIAITAAIVGITVLSIAVGAANALEAGLAALGFASDRIALDVGLLAAAVLCSVAVLVKCCFVPEACFVGGYGPIEAVRMSWRLTTVHRRKALVLTAGLAALFAISALLGTGGTGGRPVILSMTVGGTTVTVRSIGLSTSGPLRLVADVVLSALYYGVFVHQYVHGLFAS